jgi:acyl carrier protein
MSNATKSELDAQRIIAIIAREIHVEEVALHADSTFEELHVDSLDAATIMFALEEEFQIVVSEEQLREFKTVGDVIGCVEALRARDVAAKDK